MRDARSSVIGFTAVPDSDGSAPARPQVRLAKLADVPTTVD